MALVWTDEEVDAVRKALEVLDNLDRAHGSGGAALLKRVDERGDPHTPVPDHDLFKASKAHRHEAIVAEDLLGGVVLELRNVRDQLRSALDKLDTLATDPRNLDDDYMHDLAERSYEIASDGGVQRLPFIDYTITDQAADDVVSGVLTMMRTRFHDSLGPVLDDLYPSDANDLRDQLYQAAHGNWA